MLSVSTPLLASLLVIIVLLSSSLTSTSVKAEHDPKGMSFEAMWKECKHAFVGVVTEVEFKDHDQEEFIGWTNRQYQISVNVTQVLKTRGKLEKESMHHRYEETEQELLHAAEKLPPHKGEGAVEHPDHVSDDLHDDETVNVGEIVHVHYWRAISRPPGYQFPDSPGIQGMREDLGMEEGKTFAFMGEYLNRDRVRRYMYRHTHPGKVRRRKHVLGRGGVGSASASASQSESQAELVEEFSYVKAYIPYIPDGVTDNINAMTSLANSASKSRSDL